MSRYLSETGQWCWEDIEVLEKALGFHGKIFHRSIPTEKKVKSYLTTEELYSLLESDVLYPHVHKTYNHHDGSYNIKVLLKSVELLTKRYLSFSELHTARVAFQAYEHTDHAGLEDRFILRAMKLCEKTMAPQRLSYCLRHLNRLVMDRLMLYEFLELFVSADDAAVVASKLPSKKIIRDGVDGRQLYDLCNFKEELTTHDDKCLKYLNKAFKESLKIIPLQITADATKKSYNKQEWVTPPLVNEAYRKEMVRKNKIQSAALDQFLNSSTIKVKLCKCGQSCACSFPYSPKIQERISEKNEATDVGDMNGNIGETFVINAKRVQSIVSKKDVEDTARQIQNIQWDIATHKQQIKKKLENRFALKNHKDSH